MSERTFTLQEAQGLLPVLEALLKRAMEGKRTAEESEAEQRQLWNRIFVMGGVQVDLLAAVRRKAAGEKATQQVQDALAEITAAGVQVKDVDQGLLDFPCVVGERVVLLCWKVGEQKIAHWHTTDEGFAGRKPLDELSENPRADKKPD